MTKASRVALAGNQWFSQFLLERMVERGMPPGLVICMPPEASAGISGYVDLGLMADKRGIPVYRPHSFGLDTEEDRAALELHGFDALLVFGWQRLIPSWLLQRCAKGAWGVHGGPLPPPRCRGQAVFNWALILGQPLFYMYLFRLEPEMDSGGIADLRQFEITPHDDILTLYHKNCIVSARMFLDNLTGILDGSVALRPQTGEPSVLPRRRPENGGIDWTWSAQRIENTVRALTLPYPGAFTHLGGMRVDLLRAHVFDSLIPFQGKAGEILEVFPNGHFLAMAVDRPVYVRDWSCTDPTAIACGACFTTRSGVFLPDPEL